MSETRLRVVRRTCISDVIARWRVEGPLVHQLTCFEALNKATGGGPVYGSRWYVMGAPDASKTLLLTQLAHIWSQQNITVGMLAVDEEDQDLVTRLVQRTAAPEWEGANFQRVHCEERDENTLELIERHLGHCGIVFYGDDCTIEDAARDLAALAASRGQRAILMIDSIQTVECEANRKNTKADASLRERITGNVRAIRAAATSYKMLVMATSEMNRAAYKAIGQSEQNDMAAAKESGAIEYSARVMLALRNVADEPNCIEARIIKNKHGPSYPHLEPFYLRIDRATQWLYSREPPAAGATVVEEAVALVSRCPRGMTTEEIRKTLGKRKEAVVAALQSAAAAGQIRREGGPKSNWIAAVIGEMVDPDSEEFP